MTQEHQEPKEPNPPIESRDLFKDTKVVRIIHDGEIYQLRLTANNRLILTK